MVAQLGRVSGWHVRDDSWIKLLVYACIHLSNLSGSWDW